MISRALEPLVPFWPGSGLSVVFLGSNMCSQRWEWCLALEFLMLPHLFLATSIQDHSEHPVTAISGSNVSLQISSLPANYKQLTWLYTTNQKILEWESNRTSFFKSKFKDRVRLNQSHALCIYNVQKEDSSTYILRVLDESGTEKDWHISLEVHDPVPKPDIEIRKTQKVNNGCHLQLSCMIPNQSINYTWYGDLGPFSTGLQNFVLEITVEPQNYSKFYTCQASNPVSSKNDTVYFTLPCKLARSSGVAWVATWLMVMVPIVPGLIWT
ncbi:CD48 antigen isoform X1 [Callorhinus ursinus]|uniref:CD48 antigen isoform X1 n=1 Tax=Callorhinus ursinus TaxID=34884 RepID=A0A3Q7N8L4_CALUR|nr:CD48 antigen isoform X1 [Callorhinus ursinus]